MKTALSIAGSDSSAGAGIQADLKTFSALGVYGCTVITTITAQNTRKVLEVFEVGRGIIEMQIQSILCDIPPDAIKIGMVYSKQIIDVVYSLINKVKVPLIVDPILAAGTGATLLRNDAFDTFTTKLIPICTLLTPNRTEAEKFADMQIRTKSDAIEAAKRIKGLGAQNVIIKGGQFRTSYVTDLLLDSRNRLTEISNPLMKIKETHGAGCNFSSAVVAYLAKGEMLKAACKLANEYVYTALKNVVRIGKGLPITNPLSVIYRDAARYHTLAELQQAVQELTHLQQFHRLIPETQTNFVYALPDASEICDVAGVCGRIIKVGDTAMAASYVEFGASHHVASAIIAYMTINPAFRSAINIRFDERLVGVCKSIFSIANYDRSKEPKRIKTKEGTSVSWGTLSALAKNPKADAIYHRGDIGKEPMITIFARNPADVVGKIKALLKNY